MSDIEVIVPKDEAHWLSLRMQDITSTEIAALFGLSPYMTEFELWHRKKEKLDVVFEENERMKWGTRLQDAIAEGIAKDEGFSVRRMIEYIRIPSLRMGASFDFEIFGEPLKPETDGLLEIKNVDGLVFKDGWETEEGKEEAPAHIELQVQYQLAVSGKAYAKIGALVGGNRVLLIHRKPETRIIEAIKARVKEFWRTIEANEPPKPDFTRDLETIARLAGYAEPGKVVEATPRINELAASYKEAGALEKAAKEKKDAAKAEMLTLIGDAEKVLCDIGTFSTGLIGPCEIPATTRKGYRMFKPSWKKSKQEVA